MNDTVIARGGCLCGAVRYEVVDEPYKVSWCHCRTCRKATGAPAVVMVMFDEGAVRYSTGTPARYESSPGVTRTHCARCGTPLTWEGQWDGRMVFELHAGTLDEPGRFAPTRHAFVDHRIDWVRFGDGLPEFDQAGPST